MYRFLIFRKFESDIGIRVPICAKSSNDLLSIEINNQRVAITSRI